MLHFAAFDLVMHWLLKSYKIDARLIWVNIVFFILKENGWFENYILNKNLIIF